MNERPVIVLTEPIVEPVVEPTVTTNARLLPRMDIIVRGSLGSADPSWGSLISINRSRVTVLTQKPYRPNTKVTLRFHCQPEHGPQVMEALDARVAWQCGSNTGFEFDPSLSAGSAALKQAPSLEVHLAKQEAKR